MKKASFLSLSALLAGVFAMTLTLSGCADKAKDKGGGGGGGDGGNKPSDDKPKTAIKPGKGTITGKIVLDGAAPDYKRTKLIEDLPVCAKCDVGDHQYWDSDQKWIVGKGKGVANVVVRLKVPADSYFEASDTAKKKALNEKVVMDQICCAFDPHVLVLFPYYHKDGKIEKTGQVLLVENSGGLDHSTKIEGNSALDNVYDQKLKPGEKNSYVLKPQSQVISVSCGQHLMMNAKIWVYDHPYAMRTGLDGEFKLEDVNIGTKLTVEFWHEAKDVFKTEEITLTEKEPTKAYGDVKLAPK